MMAVPRARTATRLDVAVVERGLAESRERAQAVIMAGHVYVDGARADKPGARVRPGAVIEVRGRPHPYVSRGGVKLAHALERFGLDVAGLVALDVGASTGGFTDVLLRRGAGRVIAVDVGRGQLHARLRADPRVVALERTNARSLTVDQVGGQVDLVTVDVSFISATKILAALAPIVRGGGAAIVLVKPQFEAAPREAKRGVVRDPEVHRRVIREVADAARRVGFAPAAVVASPITGPEGNVEFVLLLRRGGEARDLTDAIARALREAPA